MLLVLVILVVTVPLAAMVARSAATTRLNATACEIIDEIHSVRHSFERHFIPEWLARESVSIVLPPNSPTPTILIVDESWLAHTAKDHDAPHEFHVVITAYDQCGMVPIDHAITRGSPLRRSLPPSVVQRLDTLGDRFSRYKSYQPQGTAGLDQWVGGATDANLLGVFPFAQLEDRQSRTHPATLGEYVATHQVIRENRNGRNPRSSSSTSIIGAIINVNTAPLPLVEAALRAAGGTGGLPAIIEARQQGKFANVPKRARSNNDDDKQTHNNSLLSNVVITNQSQAWAFRIDITVNQCTRSWWTIYARSSSPNRTSTNSEWEWVQRLAIIQTSTH